MVFVFQFFHFLNEYIAHSAEQWWIAPLIGLFCLIDGFFLFLPSETAIVALSAIAVKVGHPNLFLLIACSAIGAIIGDNIAFRMGRAIGTAGFKWMRRPKVAKSMEWARHELEKRGAVLILTARYIPVGRIAVNFTAGATGYSWRKFFFTDATACVTWVLYGVGIGTFAGHWLGHNHLLSAGIAIVFAIIMGFVLDRAMLLIHKLMDRRTQAKENAADEAEVKKEPAASELVTHTLVPADTSKHARASLPVE